MEFRPWDPVFMTVFHGHKSTTQVGIILGSVQRGIMTYIKIIDSPIGEIGKTTIISYIFAFLIYSVVSSFLVPCGQIKKMKHRKINILSHDNLI